MIVTAAALAGAEGSHRWCFVRLVGGVREKGLVSGVIHSRTFAIKTYLMHIFSLVHLAVAVAVCKEMQGWICHKKNGPG